MDLKAVASAFGGGEGDEARRMAAKQKMEERKKQKEQSSTQTGEAVGTVLGALVGGLATQSPQGVMQGAKMGGQLGGTAGKLAGGGELSSEDVEKSLGSFMGMPGGGELLGMSGGGEGASVQQATAAADKMKNLDKQLKAGLIDQATYDKFKAFYAM